MTTTFITTVQTASFSMFTRRNFNSYSRFTGWTQPGFNMIACAVESA